MLKKEEILEIINEFEERKTGEALFAFFCDKLECDLQCKLYDEEGCVDLSNQDNLMMEEKRVKELLGQNKTWSDMWMSFSKSSYSYDENFMKVSEYARTNNIKDIIN